MNFTILNGDYINLDKVEMVAFVGDTAIIHYSSGKVEEYSTLSKAERDVLKDRMREDGDRLE